MAYLLDTNIFIQSKNTMPFDLWPTFWNKFDSLLNSGNVYSIWKVKEEIDKGKDYLCEWVKDHLPKSFFIEMDEDIMRKYVELSNAIRIGTSYREQALYDFSQAADSYLVATAAAKGMTVVTYEGSSPESKKRVLIPDACNKVGVPHCNLNAVLEEMGFTI